MKRLASASLAAVLVAAAGAAVVQASRERRQPATGAADLEWRTDLAAARAEAERDGRPLLVVFR